MTDEEDAEYRLAIEASKHQEEEDRKKRESRNTDEDDDDLANNVRSMMAQVQSFDPFADRFRYPADRAGKPYVGVAVDLDELFQAHWIITTWCEGAVMEMRGDV